MRLIPVNSVTSGVVLRQSIYCENGDVLLKKDVFLIDNPLTPSIENNIFTIYTYKRTLQTNIAFGIDGFVTFTYCYCM